MPLKKLEHIKKIKEKLAFIRMCISSDNESHYYDINTGMEDFCAGLLNQAFGWNLKNLNYEEKNAPAIDLFDEANRIAVQVTSDTTSTKIRKTLSKFLENHYQTKYDRLIIFLLDKRKDYSIDVSEYSDFFTKADIWDFDVFVNKIQELDTEIIVNVKDYIFKEFPYSDLNARSSYEQWRNILKKIDENNEGEVYIEAKTIFPEEMLKIYEKLRGAKREYQKCKEYFNCMIDIVYSGMEPEEKEEAELLERECEKYDDYTQYDEFMSGYSALVDVPYLEKHWINYADICHQMRIANMQEQILRAELKEKIIEFMRKKALGL